LPWMGLTIMTTLGYSMLVLLALGQMGSPDMHREPQTPRVAAMLQSGQQPVKIVCFGDSITGRYYHTGKDRAYSDMLEIALHRLYPDGQVEMFNAGKSGGTTGKGVTRFERDVLVRKPDLVIVMFGMNDVLRGDGDAAHGEFLDNMTQIVERSLETGAEVVLCTPTAVYPMGTYDFSTGSYRSAQKLQEYSEIIRKLADEYQLPVADFYRIFNHIRANDPETWMLLMSEIIHPNMNGHKIMAEELASIITGQSVCLKDVPAPQPAVTRTLGVLEASKRAEVIAMPPYDRLIGPALRELVPDAQVRVTTWPTKGKTLQQIGEWIARVGCQQQADLVLLAIPAGARPDSARGTQRILASTGTNPLLGRLALPADASIGQHERLIWYYSTITSILMLSTLANADCIAVMPSVTDQTSSDEVVQRLMREVMMGKDMAIVERNEADTGSSLEVLIQWLKRQIR